MSLALASRRSALTPRWVTNDLWRRAKAVPSLDLRFAENKSLVDATTGLQLVTFSRTSEKTVRGPTSPILVPSGLPAFEDDPFTGESLGLLIEEQRVQILELTDTLATQTKTVTAVAHTLSFYGTGTVVLSGAHSAMVVGLGAYPTRTTLTFTPSAGSLTLTVSGSVRFAQLEAGSFATSYIPNSGTSQVTRAADVASITGSNFSSWYRQDEGSLFTDCTINYAVPGTSFPLAASFNDGTSNNRIENGFLTASLAGFEVVAGGAAQASIYPNASNVLSRRLATGFRLNDFAASVNGGSINIDTSGTVPTVDRLRFGDRTGSPANNLFGTIRRLTYWPQRLPNSTLQAITQ